MGNSVTITGTITTGLSVSSNYSYLGIASSGKVTGETISASVYLAGVATVGNAGIVNAGTAAGGRGVYFNLGGYLNNFGAVTGDTGVDFSAGVPTQGTLRNYGSILGYSNGAILAEGGIVTNAGQIEGGINGVDAYGANPTTIINSGTIFATSIFGSSGYAGVKISGGDLSNYGQIVANTFGVTESNTTVTNGGTIFAITGVRLDTGGELVNLSGYGSPSASGYIQALQIGVEAFGGTVHNRGRITAVGGTATTYGVLLFSGASLKNGAITDHSAVIEAMTGVASGGGSLVINYATILSTSSLTTQAAVSVQGGSKLINGEPGDFAVIKGETAVSVTAGGTVVNYGFIDSTDPYFYPGTYGIRFTIGGTLQNGSNASRSGLILGYSGVYFAGAAGTVSNFATIESNNPDAGLGVGMAKGGKITNGSLADQTALIEAGEAVSTTGTTTLVNFGTLLATSGQAVRLSNGGIVINGAATDPHALIEGYVGLEVFGSSTISNFGTVEGTRIGYAGVFLNGGAIYNGSGGDTTALISGAVGLQSLGLVQVNNYATINGALAEGVLGAGGSVINGRGPGAVALIKGVGGINESGSATVNNIGVIDGTTSFGISLKAGGAVFNGGGGQASALIEGITAIVMGGLGAVNNYATINGGQGFGVRMLAGGAVINGGGLNHSALIEGLVGVEITGNAGTVKNFGTVMATGGAVADYALELGTGSTVLNGSAGNSTALIEGYTGMSIYGATVSNFGTIRGAGDAGGEGALVSGGAALITNGNLKHSNALIEGYIGADFFGSGILTNFGTVEGIGGTAVSFGVASDTLVVEAGSTFIGSILGGGGTLELANGAGTLTGLFAGGGVTVSGSMAPTSFSSFGTLKIDAPASFGLAGAGGTIAAGETLTLLGSLSGAGVLALTGGAANFDTGAVMTVAKVTESGASTVANFNAALLNLSDVWTQTSGTVAVATADRVNFTGVGDAFSGTFSGAGTVAFTGGSDTLSGVTLKAASQLINGASVTLSGAIALPTTLAVTSTNLTVGAGGASLAGGGSLILSNLATNIVKGATAASTLTNISAHIDGAGQLGGGSMVLVNQAAGLIIANDSNALVINTGAATITNAGVLENTSTGGLTITSAIANTGSLTVTAGTLTLDGAVSGAGTVRIGGGVAAVATKAFTENVTFTATTGVLELANSVGYTGQVTGLATAGTNSLDLLDIAFGGSTKASFSGTATSGTLTVTDGTHTAHVTLEGNYVGHTFHVASDGHGGTSVIDPPAITGSGRNPPHKPLVQAIAGFGGGAAAAIRLGEGVFDRPSVLARPA